MQPRTGATRNYDIVRPDLRKTANRQGPSAGLTEGDLLAVCSAGAYGFVT